MYRIQELSSYFVLLAYLLASSGCVLYDGRPNLLLNWSFDQWCGDAPCDWEVAVGHVRKSGPTWSAGDRGAALLGPETELQQVVSGTWTVDVYHDCWYIDAVVDTDNGDATIELDFGADGTSEWTQQVPVGEWSEVHATLLPPVYYSSVAAIVHKASGSATAARLQLRTAHQEYPGGDGNYAPPCDGPQVVAPAPDGFPCESDDGCAGSTCAYAGADGLSWSDYGSWYSAAGISTTCGGCAEDVECAGGEVCGTDAVAGGFLYRACEAPGNAALAEACAEDAECETGICEAGRCSECREGGETCGCVERVVNGIWRVAHTCEGGSRRAGDRCLMSEDCASGACDGAALSACANDGRTCATDTDCGPADQCVLIGVRDGVCG